MKKLGLLITILVLSFSAIIGVAAYGDNDIPYDYFVPKKEIVIEDAKYVTGVDENTVVVVGVNANGNGSAVVPATVTIGDVEYEVTAISADAFKNSSATEIRLPNTITTPVTLDLTGFGGYIFIQSKTKTAEAISVTNNTESVPVPGIYYKGDYNGDGEAGMGDIIKVLQAIAGDEVTGYSALACDVVENGKADIGDAIRLLQWTTSDSTVLD